MNQEKGQRCFQTRNQSLIRSRMNPSRVLVQWRVGWSGRSRRNRRWKGRRMGRWRAKSFERDVSVGEIVGESDGTSE